jgi:hypothetical protein
MAATTKPAVLINMEELLQVFKKFETRRLEVSVKAELTVWTRD